LDAEVFEFTICLSGNEELLRDTKPQLTYLVMASSFFVSDES
jgi:hypothetical protein